TAFGRPLYVIAKNASDHTVVMGDDALLYSDTVRVKEFNLLYPDYDPDHLTAKHRYGQPDMPAALSLNGSEAVITFKKPQRAVTPGQFAVVYDGETVVGGGEICE
ncbi:MAG TPA: tRNA 2-thiouridine(34) synthase MnmA, partial [Clostridiales bacterium]|nr:tRNA 2-thiouridine(34) synthase MnmA [Clostridiales bacterium]